MCSLRSEKCLLTRRSLTLRSAFGARHRRTVPHVQRSGPRADADAHAGAVANATMPRHRHAITGFRTSRSACLSLQRARFHPPRRSNVAVAVHPSLRSNVFMRAVGVTTSPLRGSTGNSRFALAKGIESAACFQSFAPGRHGLPQSSQTGQPSQTAECVGAPAQTRERALRAPSRDWLAWC